jgi:hypothetical protein
MSAQLEGEEEDLPVPGIEQTAAPPSPSNSSSLNTPSTPSTPAKTPTKVVQPELREELLTPLRRSIHIRKPSRIICDAQSGEGITSARGVLPQTIPHPPIPDLVKAEEEEEEAGGVWAIVDGDPTLLEEFEGLVNVFMAETADLEALEPRTIAEAKHRSDWPEWEKAILEELETLRAAGTWILEEAPPGANIIGSKWVFKAKKDAAGFIARLKARLMAQGFSQIGGIDFDNTYAPMARLASFRAIIAMANRLDLLLHQVDIKGAYLN